MHMHTGFQPLSRFRAAPLIKPHFLSLTTKGSRLASQTKSLSILWDGPFGYGPAVLTNSCLCSAWVNTFHSPKGVASSCLDFPFIFHFGVPLKMGIQYSSSPQQKQDGATNTLIKIMGGCFDNCAMRLAFKDKV